MKKNNAAKALAKKKAVAEDKREEGKLKGAKLKRHEASESKKYESMEDSQYRK